MNKKLFIFLIYTVYDTTQLASMKKVGTNDGNDLVKTGQNSTMYNTISALHCESLMSSRGIL